MDNSALAQPRFGVGEFWHKKMEIAGPHGVASVHGFLFFFVGERVRGNKQLDEGGGILRSNRNAGRD